MTREFEDEATLMDDLDAVRCLLQGMDAGVDCESDQLLPLIYDELKAMARRQMSDQGAGHTLQTTALVHEAWIRLSGKPKSGRPANAVLDRLSQSEGRAHFMRLASSVMRHILIDHARMRGAQKRGGAIRRLEFDESSYCLESDAPFLLTLDDSVERLLEIDERMGRLVELRCFGGLNQTEIAEALNISRRQVNRTWRAARAWLRTEFG